MGSVPMKSDMNQLVVQREMGGSFVEGMFSASSPGPLEPTFDQMAGWVDFRATIRTQRSTLAPSRDMSWVPGRMAVVMMWSMMKAFSSGRKSRRRPARKLRDWQ